MSDPSEARLGGPNDYIDFLRIQRGEPLPAEQIHPDQERTTKMKWAKVLAGKIKEVSTEDIILTDEEVNSGVIVVQVSDDAEVGTDVAATEPAPESPAA